jgi:protein-disulfide isomerase
MGGKGFYLLVAAVVVAGGFLLFRARASNEVEDLAPVSLAGGEVAADMSTGSTYGPDDRPVVIMEFADYLCPHCRQFNSLSGKLLRQNHAGSGGSVQWISFDFPLWPESWAPAIAAQCAKRQGKYWEMHDLLFARVDSWREDGNPNRKFVDYARDLGLDAGAFKSCVDGQETLAEVRATRAYGESIGITGTPTIFFNGQQVTQGMDYGSLEERIQAFTASGE